MSENNKSYGSSLPALSERIRQWRVARKVTQAELEQKAGLSHNTVSRIECGIVSPRIDTIERISKALDVSIEQLQFQQPHNKVAEKREDYGGDAQVSELIEALAQVPEHKRANLIRTFIELVRMAVGGSNE